MAANGICGKLERSVQRRIWGNTSTRREICFVVKIRYEGANGCCNNSWAVTVNSYLKLQNIAKVEEIVQQLKDLKQNISDTMVITKIVLMLPTNFNHFHSV